MYPYPIDQTLRQIPELLFQASLALCGWTHILQALLSESQRGHKDSCLASTVRLKVNLATSRDAPSQDLKGSGRVKDIVNNIRKLAHVPVQTWKGIKVWDPSSLYGRRLSTLGGYKSLIGIVDILMLTSLLLSCLAPLYIKAIRSTIETVVERRTTTKILTLCKALSKKR